MSTVLRFHLSRLLLAVAVGILGALTTALFRCAMSLLEQLMLGHSGSLVMAAYQLPLWRRALTPALGGLVAGYFLHLSRVLANEQRHEYMEAVVVGDGLLEVRVGLLRSLSSLFAVTSGGAVGREGAMISMATLAASGLGRHLLSPKNLHLAVSCAAAAGLAAAYNVPLAASIFVSEILLGRLDLQTTGPLMVAAVAAHVTVMGIHGDRPFFAVAPLGPVSAGWVTLMLLVGVACGLMAPAFLWWLRTTRAAFKSLNWPLPLVLGLGGLIVGVLSLACPEVWGNGYSVVQRILDQDFGWRAVAMIFLLKLVAVGATTGSGAPGGVFTPTLFVGASLGTLFGCALCGLVPGASTGMALCTLTGMAALLAGTTHAPVMASLMTVEMTASASVLPALLPACVLAATIARALQPAPVYLEAMKVEPQGKSGFIKMR